MHFDEILEWKPAGEGRWTHRIGGHWYQGRGVFGGAIGASFARVFRWELGEGHATLVAPAAEDAGGGAPFYLRAMTLQFLLPMEDSEAEIRTEVLRAGRTVTHLRGDLWQGGKRIASATSAWVRPGSAAADFDQHPFPDVPPPEEVPPWPDLPLMPAFARGVEFRQCLGPTPWSGAEQAHVGGWTQLRCPRALDEALAVAFLDTWPPPIVTRTNAPGAAATILLHLELPRPLPLEGSSPEDWWLVEHRSYGGRGAFHEESARMWSREGRLVGRAMQVRALFGT